MSVALRAGLVVVAAAAALATPAAQAQVASSAASAPSSAAKKALVQRILTLQQGEIEALARNVVERPAAQMLQEAGLAVQQQIPPDRREAVGRAIEAEVKKYVEEAYPLVRDRALKLAPSTIGAVLEARMSEDDLRTLVTWLDSSANKKYQQVAVEMRNGFFQKLLADMPALLDPKLQALNGRIRVILGLPPVPAPTLAPAARPASK